MKSCPHRDPEPINDDSYPYKVPNGDSSEDVLAYYCRDCGLFGVVDEKQEMIWGHLP